MRDEDLLLLRELTLLLDLSYQHHYAGDPSAAQFYKGSEAAVRLEFGNLWSTQRLNPGVVRL